MSQAEPLVSDVAAAAVVEGSAALVVESLVLAGRRCAREEARGDVRDGLLDMPLPFRAAEKLGLDPDELLRAALDRLDGRAAELLADFGARTDRARTESMGWHETTVDGRFAFRFAWPA